jgi:hypothetical protein
MLDDPRVNFAISTRGRAPGLDHLGIQVENKGEHHEVYGRLHNAGGNIVEQGQTSCCYAKSEKTRLRHDRFSLEVVERVCRTRCTGHDAAGEACPLWPGQPMTAHWGVPDPAEAKGLLGFVLKKAWKRQAFRPRRSQLPGGCGVRP